MRIARVKIKEKVVYALIEGEDIRPLKKAPWQGIAPEIDKIPLCEVRLLAPVEPSKIVAVGLNYGDHIREMNHEIPKDPVLFIKPSTSVIGPDDNIVWPTMAHRVDHEAELAVVIGKTAKDIEPEQVNEYILGYTCLNDVTARDLQKQDGQWTRAKGFDTFCPIGPWIETQLDVRDVAVEARLNGQTRQLSSTAYMLKTIPELVSFVSKAMTLLPGDVIATGTPSGIGPMMSGDVIEIEIGGIGVLRNRMVRL